MNPTEPVPPKRRGGRPNTGKRGTFTFRVTDSLRQKLEAQAVLAGRPVSEEIEMRLEASFVQPSPHTAAVVALVSSTTNIVETLMGSTWREDYRVAAEVRAAIDEVLNKYMPASAPNETGRERVAAALLRRGAFGRGLARSLNGDEIAEEDRQAFLGDFANALSPDLRRKLVEGVENSSGQESNEPEKAA